MHTKKSNVKRRKQGTTEARKNSGEEKGKGEREMGKKTEIETS